MDQNEVFVSNAISLTGKLNIYYTENTVWASGVSTNLTLSSKSNCKHTDPLQIPADVTIALYI